MSRAPSSTPNSCHPPASSPPTGIALGVTVDKCGQAVALTVALVFHQGLEGIGLGSAIVKACFTTGKAVAMVVTYAVMTPLGIAIGMALAGSYDPESTTALGVQVGSLRR